jgi:phosphatidate cytidylyltransferase
MPGLVRRLLTAGVILPPIALAIYAGPRWLAVAIALLSVWGVWEMVRILRARGFVATPWLPAAGALLLIATRVPEPAGFGSLIPCPLSAALVVVTIVAMAYELFRKDGGMLTRFPFTIMVSIYLGLLPAHILGFYDLDRAGVMRSWPVYSALILVWTCDTAAYFVGSRFGRHKLIPRVSPSKSWEGSIAGVLATIAVAVALGSRLTAGPVYLRIGAGILVGVFAQIGDLGESLMKREASVKDSGNAFPGHGGVLDRLDSLVLAIPVLYYWLHWTSRVGG